MDSSTWLKITCGCSGACAPPLGPWFLGDSRLWGTGVDAPNICNCGNSWGPVQIGYTSQAVTSFVFLQSKSSFVQAFKTYTNIYRCQLRGLYQGGYGTQMGLTGMILRRNLFWGTWSREGEGGNEAAAQSQEVRDGKHVRQKSQWSPPGLMGKGGPHWLSSEPSVWASPVLQAGKHYRFSWVPEGHPGPHRSWHKVAIPHILKQLTLEFEAVLC